MTDYISQLVQNPELESKFFAFAKGHSINATQLISLLKGCSILPSASLSYTELDILFAKSRCRGATKLDYAGFCSLLNDICSRLSMDLSYLITAVSEGMCSVSAAASSRSVARGPARFFYDVTTYTGTQATRWSVKSENEFPSTNSTKAQLPGLSRKTSLGSQIPKASELARDARTARRSSTGSSVHAPYGDRQSCGDNASELVDSDTGMVSGTSRCGISGQVDVTEQQPSHASHLVDSKFTGSPIRENDSSLINSDWSPILSSSGLKIASRKGEVNPKKDLRGKQVAPSSEQSPIHVVLRRQIDVSELKSSSIPRSRPDWVSSAGRATNVLSNERVKEVKEVGFRPKSEGQASVSARPRRTASARRDAGFPKSRVPSSRLESARGQEFERNSFSQPTYYTNTGSAGYVGMPAYTGISHMPYSYVGGVTYPAEGFSPLVTQELTPTGGDYQYGEGHHYGEDHQYGGNHSYDGVSGAHIPHSDSGAPGSLLCHPNLNAVTQKFGLFVPASDFMRACVEKAILKQEGSMSVASSAHVDASSAHLDASSVHLGASSVHVDISAAPHQSGVNTHNSGPATLRDSLLLSPIVEDVRAECVPETLPESVADSCVDAVREMVVEALQRESVDNRSSLELPDLQVAACESSHSSTPESAGPLADASDTALENALEDAKQKVSDAGTHVELAITMEPQDLPTEIGVGS